MLAPCLIFNEGCLLGIGKPKPYAAISALTSFRRLKCARVEASDKKHVGPQNIAHCDFSKLICKAPLARGRPLGITVRFVFEIGKDSYVVLLVYIDFHRVHRLPNQEHNPEN